MSTVLLYADVRHAQLWANPLANTLQEYGWKSELASVDSPLETFLATTQYAAVVIMTAPDHEIITPINRICRDYRQDALFVGQRTHAFQVGPATADSSFACLNCWQQHRYFFFDETLNSAEIDTHIIRQAADVLNTFLNKTPGSPLRRGHYVQLDFTDHAEHWYITEKHPNCRVCSAWRRQPTEVVAAY